MRLLIQIIFALFLTSCTFNTAVETPNVEMEATAAGSAPNDERFALTSGSVKSKPAPKSMPPAAGPSGERRAMMEAAAAAPEITQNLEPIFSSAIIVWRKRKKMRKSERLKIPQYILWTAPTILFTSLHLRFPKSRMI